MKRSIGIDRLFQDSRIGYLALLIAVAAGTYARFWNLGFAAVALDEFHSVLAVEFILESGLPRFESGGFYTRGLLLNYVVAGLSALSGLEPLLVFRWVTACASTATLYGIFLLGQTLFGRGVGLATTLLMALSLLDIDSARYARMYAPFHAIAVFYFYHLAVSMKDDESPRFGWLLGLSALAVLVSKAAALLAVANLLALFLAPRARLGLPALGTVAVLAFNLIMQAIPWRAIGAEPRLAADHVPLANVGDAPTLGPLILPPGGLTALVVLAVLTALACVALFWYSRRNSKLTRRQTLACAILALSIASLASGWLLLGVASAVAAWCMFPEFAWRDHMKPAAVALAVAAVGVGLSVTKVVLQAGTSSIRSLAKELLNSSLGYPEVLDAVILPWIRQLPITSTVLAVGLALLVIFGSVRYRRGEHETGPALLMVSVLVIVVLTLASLWTPYRQIRYTQFLYPLGLTLSLGGMSLTLKFIGLTRSRLAISFSAIFGLLVAASDDLSFNYLSHVGTYETTYRLQPGLGMLRARSDYLSPAEFLARTEPTDTVITTVRQIAFHSDRIDAVLMLTTDRRYDISTASRGTRELWTHLPMINSTDGGIERLCEGGTVNGYVVYPGSSYRFMSSADDFVHALPGDVVFESDDRRIRIKRVVASSLGPLCAAER
ncbi:MAG: glycosyltransferase family 39 protein [Pseudomonadota bacterium]